MPEYQDDEFGFSATGRAEIDARARSARRQLAQHARGAIFLIRRWGFQRAAPATSAGDEAPAELWRCWEAPELDATRRKSR